VSLPTLVVLLSRLGRLNEAVIQEICRRHDITAAEIQVLAVLRHTANEGPANPTSLARTIVQTSGGFSATLRRLEARGFARRLPDPADGRGRLIEITASGEAIFDDAFADLLARFRFLFDGIDVDVALTTVRDLVNAFERFANLGSTATWELEDRS
jgi:DNA-binding MarR family transcriptional regulator